MSIKCNSFNPTSHSQGLNPGKFSDKKANDWTPEKGFLSEDLKNDKYGYPRPAVGMLDRIATKKNHIYPISFISKCIGTGTPIGLTIVLNAEIGDYYCSCTNSYGFKILLHSPIETPRIAHFGSSLMSGYESRVIISPSISVATESIRKMPINVRRCLFEDENYLTYYR